ncbi:hypothetical protein SDC9_40182 [bioreactor metagenome]|uniref:Uncharacterized protein n=1 Tax=bioreactor metagenome TaxID=1076179 RepID=A0A644VRK3_9ZZZZ
MPAIALVMRYSGLNYKETLDLPADIFLLLRKNALIDDYKATPEGREYLKKCERLRQTDPDLEKVREFNARGGGKHGHA